MQADGILFAALRQYLSVTGYIMTPPKCVIYKFMKAYISVSFTNRKLVAKEINAIIGTLSKFEISSIVFVDNYRFEPAQERLIMEYAMAEIDNCDLLLAETSDKGIGIGIEVGYAKAKGKTVIYLRQKDKEHSTTVSGISDFQIAYTDTLDLKKQLAETVENYHGQTPI